MKSKRKTFFEIENKKISKRSAEMGFSTQGKSVHDALIARQDAEIRLIEIMRRCLSQKAKSDREYGIALTNVTQQGLKIDRVDDLAGKLTFDRH